MNSKRIIHLIGEVNYELYERFSSQLALFEQDGNKEVMVELCSEGGDAEVALAFRSRIKTSRLDIVITGVGTVASAAVLILAAGDKRYMSDESWVMVHEEEGELSGSVSQLEAQVKQMRVMENQWCLLLEKDTGTLRDFWANLHKKTTYLDAKQCIDLGLIDEII